MMDKRNLVLTTAEAVGKKVVENESFNGSKVSATRLRAAGRGIAKTAMVSLLATMNDGEPKAGDVIEAFHDTALYYTRKEYIGWRLEDKKLVGHIPGEDNRVDCAIELHIPYHPGSHERNVILDEFWKTMDKLLGVKHKFFERHVVVRIWNIAA